MQQTSGMASSTLPRSVGSFGTKKPHQGLSKEQETSTIKSLRPGPSAPAVAEFGDDGFLDWSRKIK